ncbi:Ras suppressor protein (contains leucine-rich repeats), partial [Handroanthus impetiginosus]
MQEEEVERIETPDLKKQENSKNVQEPEDLEENCGEKDLKLNSIIDVSGKTLDFPLINCEGTTVEEVYMYKNEFNLIPRAVVSLKNLKTLKFFSNEVNLFPGEFGNLVELESLQLKVAAPRVNGLELSKLRNLKELELSRVPSRASLFPLFTEIAGLKSLTRLSVCHFSIRYLPPEIGCLNNLEHLDLSFNKLRNLPDEIASLNLLVSLKVANNKLIDLPSRLSYLQRLENLDLSNNQLTSLECLELGSMHNLQILNLQHNQLRGCQIPSWICCNLEGNVRDISNDESAEMDVYEGVVQEIHGTHLVKMPCDLPSPLLRPPTQTLQQPQYAQSAEGSTRRYNSRTEARMERLDNCKKWKVAATVQSSSETCRMSAQGDSASSKGLSVAADVKPDNEDSVPVGEMHGNPLISPGNEDFIPTKESGNGCSCSAVDSSGMHKEVEPDVSRSNANLNSPSDAVELLDGGSSTQSSNGLLKSKRHSEKDLDNPKPMKSRRPSSDPSKLSRQYSELSYCGVADHLPDGFYDAGRDRPFMPLASYEKYPHVNSREVILLDRERDEELDAILLCAQALLYKFKQMNNSVNEHRELAMDSLQIASLLALFVSDHFGGSDKSYFIQRTRKAVSGSNYRKPFVCTCTTGITSDTSEVIKQGVDTVEDVVFHDICEKSLQSMKERRNSIIVPIGGLRLGVCRHRALLMKYLCDRMEPRIPCELVRGYLDFSPHAWNVIVMKRGESLVRMIVDACRPHDIREERDPEYFCRYIPLSRLISPIVADQYASPNCSFPSLAVCDEIGELASTSLMCCSIGSLDAAVKLRTMEVAGASADEIRNFELCCLGEVRMLTVLKHSCIVEFYGHQISSKWSVTADGNCGDRTLQSVILMEYVKGGSLKCYVEKLSSAGEK